MRTKRLLIVLFLLSPLAMISQSLSGYVMDQDNNPIPFVNVYFQGTQEATNTKDDGSYYHQLREAGFYEVVYSAVGYKNTIIEVTFDVGEDVVKNIYLERDITEIKEAVIKAKRRDPAYEIIASAIDAKEQWKKQYESSQSHVYIKAKEVISEKEKKKREKQKELEEKKKEEEKKSLEEEQEEDKEDIFEKEKKEREEAINKVTSSMNMVEIDMERSYQYPGKVKEIRNGFKKFGNTYGLYFINTAEADFNFYDNLMSLDNLNELPLVSPLHITSILTYKFSLEETYYDGPNQIFKISVTPRKKGNASWTGHIWIQNENFCIRKVDLHLEKGGLYIYDEFRIKQEYELLNDSTTILSSQEFDYISKDGGRKFTGNTFVKYSDYELNVEFPKNFFRNEVAVTTQEAYDKDSTYWHNSRPKPLTIEEQRFQFVKDSIETVVTSKEYMDSLDLVNNKITFLDVSWLGIDHINRSEKRVWYLNPLASVWNPFSVGGSRLGYGGSYFKRWENQKYLAGNTYASYGLRNKDIKGNAQITYLYDPMHRGSFTLMGADRFNVVAVNDAITNILQRSNWIREKTGQIIYRRELFNGFYIRPAFVLIQRSSITDLQFNPNADDLVPNNQPYDFETYDASIFDIELSYTPFQKYMTEPYRKVILGSKWPTFSASMQTGVHDLFGSDVQYTRVTGRISQSFKLGTLGTSSYKIQGGKYLNTNILTREDSKIFPRGDKWLFASLMESMQLQDTTLVAREIYLQAHFIHHFNGALVNYIPIVKKLGIHFSAGASALYIEDSNYRYVEGFVGVERSFKIQRYRYRVGLFFVAADANTGDITPRMKIAFSQYNVRDKSWGY